MLTKYKLDILIFATYFFAKIEKHLHKSVTILLDSFQVLCRSRNYWNYKHQNL